MFTGIIQAVEPILRSSRKNGSMLLEVRRPRGWRLKKGDSIAVDGTCLTITDTSNGRYKTTLMPETLEKTAFGGALPKYVNLEPPVPASGALHGHIVLGHVDAVGTIAGIKSEGSSRVYEVSFSKKFNDLLVEKGSIAVDGISLTVVRAGNGIFSVALIPHTLAHTTIGSKKVGDKVNLEFDILAKHISAAFRRYARR